MKTNNILKSITIIFASSLMMISCQKDYNAFPADPVRTPQINATRGTFTCEINGVPFKGEIKRMYDTSSYIVTAIEYDYTRQPENYKSITLRINNINSYTDKKFQIGSVASATYVFAQKDKPTRVYSTIYNNENSFWKVTNVRPTAKGEFSFNAATTISGKDSVKITNGVYDFPTD